MCLFKTGACLIQVHFNIFVISGNCLHYCLIQVACLIEVATKTGFTVIANSVDPDLTAPLGTV